MMSDIDDDFDDVFDDGEDNDAKVADESETSVREKKNTLEKRLMIDNLLEEKRLEKELKDSFDDLDNFDDFDDLDDLDDI